jgi:hypothetical protein
MVVLARVRAFSSNYLTTPPALRGAGENDDPKASTVPGKTDPPENNRTGRILSHETVV